MHSSMDLCGTRIPRRYITNYKLDLLRSVKCVVCKLDENMKVAYTFQISLLRKETLKAGVPMDTQPPTMIIARLWPN